jgi:hypothetical protein
MSIVKNKIFMEPFFDYDESQFTYKIFYNYQFITCDNTKFINY